MHPRHLIFLVLPAAILLTFTSNSKATDQITQPDKTLVLDGHVIHNLGHLTNNVTNFGLIGSQPTATSSFSTAPSARWPNDAGDDYLWGAGLWVGGVVLGQTRVSTGQNSHEIMASPAPNDTIYSPLRGAPGSRRYPWPGADDDGDGVEDEDPLDGIDNDGDGLIDEDFGAIGDQEFSCVMSDTTAQARDLYADHIPLDISVSQRSFQWDSPETADFIGYEYTIINIGTHDIQNIHCGLYSDFDIGPRGTAGIAQDDLAGGWTGSLVRTSDGSWVPVSLAYMRDGATGDASPGWAGWAFCELATDPRRPDIPPTPLTMRIIEAQTPFQDGGDPTNDAERYLLLSSGTWDSNVSPAKAADYRVLIAGPGPAALAPGDSLTLRVVLALGTDLSDLLSNAAEGVRTCYGGYFDRDGDSGNLDEFRVPWWRPADGPSAVPLPTPASELSLTVAPNPFNPRVTLSFTLPEPGTASLTIHDLRGRLVRALLPESRVSTTIHAVWDGTDTTGRAVASGVYVARLVAGNQVAEQRVTLVR